MKSDNINCPSSDSEKSNDEWNEVTFSHQNQNDSGMTSLPPHILPMSEASPSDCDLTIIVAGTTSPSSKTAKLAPTESNSNPSDPKASNHNRFYAFTPLDQKPSTSKQQQWVVPPKSEQQLKDAKAAGDKE